MKVIPCSFPELHPVGEHYVAFFTRTGEHPRLGHQKDGQITRTSAIKRIDFELGYLETQNNIYSWKGKLR